MTDSFHFLCNCSHSISPLCSIPGILLETNLCFLFHLLLPGLLWSSSLCLATHFHFKIQSNPQKLSSFLLNICPYHLTPFDVTNRSVVSLNRNVHLFFSRLFVHNFPIAHGYGSHYSSLLKITFSFSFKHHVLMILGNDKLTFHFQMKPVSK